MCIFFVFLCTPHLAMRTNIEIDDKLIKEIRKKTKAKTK